MDSSVCLPEQPLCTQLRTRPKDDDPPHPKEEAQVHPIGQSRPSLSPSVTERLGSSWVLRVSFMEEVNFDVGFSGQATSLLLHFLISFTLDE